MTKGLISIKNDSRVFLKERMGIRESEQKVKCKTCLFHSRRKVCQIHGIRTQVDEVCPRYKHPTRKKVYLGGKMS